MTIDNDISLATLSTMGLGGRVKYFTRVESKQDLVDALNFANQNKLPTLMIGTGSNIVWRDEGFDGLLLVNAIRGFEIENKNEQGADILIGGGEEWDLVVDRTVSLGLSGIECLSLIPGTAGATPVQNVGAYGQQISETLVSLDAFDTKNKTFQTMVNKDCDFSYRNSCFKKEPGRYFILTIRLHLIKDQMSPPLYKSLEDYLFKNNIKDTSPKTLRQAVIAIRQSKLPDPKVVKNCGSFFKNPIVSKETFEQLVNKHQDVPHWDMSSGQVKISAAWLIENTGFKDYSDSETGMATWKGQPLILVNENAKSTGDLLSFKMRIVNSVKDKFSITLEQEPELLP